MQRIAEAEVDLVLRKCALVMPHFHLEPHRVQRLHQFAAHLYRLIVWGEVEVAAHIMRHRVNINAAVAPEEEELRLGAHHEGPAALLDLRQFAPQQPARVAVEGRTVHLIDIAEQPRAFHVGRSPG